MPIIQVQILEGRDDDQIRDLISGITENTVRILNVKPEQVRVIVQTVPKRYWGVCGITKEELDGLKGN